MSSDKFEFDSIGKQTLLGDSLMSSQIEKHNAIYMCGTWGAAAGIFLSDLDFCKILVEASLPDYEVLNFRLLLLSH